MPLSVALHTLGCKLNQYETQRMLEEFVGAGFEISHLGEPVDVVVINTCTVTGKTDHRSRGAIRRAVKSRVPKPLVAVTGCYAQMFPEQVRAIDGVDLVIGNREKQGLVGEVVKLLAERGIEPIKEPSCPTGHGITGFAGHTRAFLRVQDGCNNACAYCIVTQARGPSRSSPLDVVLGETRGLLDSGFKEIVLVGVHLGCWGRDLERGGSIRDLVQAILALGPDFRLRLSSIEPMAITDELIGFMAGEPRICAHLHIPLQSGSDAVLKRMNRQYDSAAYGGLVNRLTRNVDGIAIGADVMVGFPGETDLEFRETVEFVRSLEFAYLHVFNYSRRPGTAAAEMKPQIAPEIRAERSKILRALSAEKSLSFRRKFIGVVRPVLIEQRADPETGQGTGITDNYIKVRLKGGFFSKNEIAVLRLTGVVRGGMTAEPAQKGDGEA